MSRRKVRLESLLRREIATTVSEELRDPRLGFVTITRCEISPDLEHVVAYYTIFGSDSSRHLSAQALHNARAYVQRRYAKSVRMRKLPRLHFAYDEGEERRSEMDELLSQLRSERGDTDEADRTPPEDTGAS